MCDDLWVKQFLLMDDFFFMYVGIGVCIVFRFGGNFLKGLFKFGFNRLDIIIFFLFIQSCLVVV